MKILVTGGAGFIGSHLCDILIKNTNSVFVIDNLILGRIDNINHLIGLSNFKFIKQDLLDFEALKHIFKSENFDMVFHLAANSDIQKGGIDPDVDYNMTFNTTFNVLQCMREFNVKKLFFASNAH